MPLWAKLKIKISSFQIIILGFGGVIFIGTLLLMLPAASKAGVVTSFENAFFTATSAVCVTGLVVVDTASYWSDFGQGVLLVLIQIGGLGVITVAIFLSMLLGRKISLKERETMQNALSAPQLGGIVRLSGFIFGTTFLAEIIGALMLLPVFVPKYGAEGIWMSVFHSISAFCNAGFDLMGNKTGEFSSFTGESGNVLLTVVISLLIITGGIGFITLRDMITNKFVLKRCTMQTKVVLTTSLVLTLIPAVFFLLTDFKDVSGRERICMAVFQAVTPRTAGFNNADLTTLSDGGRTVTMLLMLIGGSPGSTAGGVKTTTVAVLIANISAVFHKRPNARAFGRRLDNSVIKNASAILMMYALLAVLAAVIISMTEDLPMQTCLFETISAIGTVGLSLGVTPGLSALSHVLLAGLMFFGRVGGLTIIYAAFSQNAGEVSKYPTEGIMIG